MQILRLAVDTCYWPLYEVENGKWKLNYKVRNKLPVIEWIKPQGRFAHLLKEENQPIVAKIQQKIDENWEKLLAKCSAD